MKPNSRRAIRAQRKAKEEMRGMQVISREDVLSLMDRLLPSRKDEAPLTLPNGTEIDPKSAWPLPGKVMEN